MYPWTPDSIAERMLRLELVKDVTTTLEVGKQARNVRKPPDDFIAGTEKSKMTKDTSG